MTTSNPYPELCIDTLVATGSMASNQFKIMQLASTAGAVKLGTSATSKIIGVLLNDPTDGQAALVQVLGVAKVLGEASVTIGSLVGCSSTGRAKIVSSANDQILGKALDAVSTAGDMIRVLLFPSNL